MHNKASAQYKCNAREERRYWYRITTDVPWVWSVSHTFIYNNLLIIAKVFGICFFKCFYKLKYVIDTLIFYGRSLVFYCCELNQQHVSYGRSQDHSFLLTNLSIVNRIYTVRVIVRNIYWPWDTFFFRILWLSKMSETLRKLRLVFTACLFNSFLASAYGMYIMSELYSAPRTMYFRALQLAFQCLSRFTTGFPCHGWCRGLTI